MTQRRHALIYINENDASFHFPAKWLVASLMRVLG